MFDCLCGYPYSIVAFSVRNWTIQHNTFYGGELIHFENKGDGIPAGNLVRDNVFLPAGGICCGQSVPTITT